MALMTHQNSLMLLFLLLQTSQMVNPSSDSVSGYEVDQ